MVMRNRMFKKLLRTCMVTAAALAAATISASACTTIYVGGNLVEEGTPFVARTEDYGADMNKLWFISEAGAYKEGEHYRGCPTYGPFEWDFTHDSYRFTYFTNDIQYNGVCPECGEGSVESPATHLSYTEFGTNEKGVSVSATETMYGNDAVKAVDPMHTAAWSEANGNAPIGIEETDIPTILLAEAASAREGVELLLDIYDHYGCVYASGLFICDKDEVWYIENCSGTQYVAIKLHDDMMFLEPNLSVIGLIDLDDTENVIASERLIEVAKEAGTFVGDEENHIIDYRASYARIGETVGARLVDGLNFLNKNYQYDDAALTADNTKFTISNLNAEGEIVPLYTNIRSDRKLTKDDVFHYYKLSSIGKPSNQEIEIFQLFKDRPVETATVGWVGVGNMSYNVFVPYYPMLIDAMYEGYQVSTPVVTKTESKPDSFATWTTREDGKYVVYPENWLDSYYFTFEGLGGYIQYAEQLVGTPVSDTTKQYVATKLEELQQELYDNFVTVEELDGAENRRALATNNGIEMAEKAHQLGQELVEYVTTQNGTANHVTYQDMLDWALEQEIISDTNVGGEEVCTRAQVIELLWRAAGCPMPSEDGAGFSDVLETASYHDAVLWAVEHGITSGVSETEFAPDMVCTHSQMVLFLYRMQGSPKVTQEDMASSAFYHTALTWATEHGLVFGGTAFDPTAGCQYSDVIVSLWQTVK